MTTKIKIVLATLAILSVICIIIYSVFSKYSPKDVSDKVPYANIIHKELITVEDAIIITNSTTEFTKNYPNELQDYSTIDTHSVSFEKIPEGSVLKFNKAVKINRFVSGNSYVFLLGNIVDKEANNQTPIIYQWGYFKTICLEEPCNYWEHRKAPWQETIDHQKYF